MVPDIMSFTPAFYSKLIIEDDGGFPFKLATVLTYVTAIRNIGTFVIPIGFATDYASIPHILWNILPPVGRYDAAAVVHDYLYQNGKVWGHELTRANADAILNEAMGVLKVAPWQRRLIYAGVRVGGWVTWNRYRKT